MRKVDDIKDDHKEESHEYIDILESGLDYLFDNEARQQALEEMEDDFSQEFSQVSLNDIDDTLSPICKKQKLSVNKDANNASTQKKTLKRFYVYTAVFTLEVSSLISTDMREIVVQKYQALISWKLLGGGQNWQRKQTRQV